jgi:hypothetical protein
VAQEYAEVLGAQIPVHVSQGGTANTAVELAAPTSLVWNDDGVVQDMVFPLAAMQLSATTNIAAPVLLFDGSRADYLIVAYKYLQGSTYTGDGQRLFFVAEGDWTNIDTWLGILFPLSVTFKWAGVARVSSTLVFPVQHYELLPLDHEGDLLYMHSLGDPSNPSTPLRYTRLPIRRTAGVPGPGDPGTTTPIRGQLLHVIPDPDDPSQAADQTYDPAWTEFGAAGAARITGDPLLRWNHLGDPEAFSASAPGAILLAPSDPADPSAYLPQFGAPSSIGLVQRSPSAAAPREGDLLYYSASAGYWVDLVIGPSSSMLGSTGTDPQWEAPSALGLVQVTGTPNEGDMLLYSGGAWTRIVKGADKTVLTVGPGVDPGWQGVAYGLEGLLSGPGELPITPSGGGLPVALPLGSDRFVLMAKFGAPTWYSITDPLHPDNGQIPLASPVAGTYRALIIDASNNLGWALISVP